MGGKSRILVVDDEAVIRESSRKILNSEGYDVQVAPDAETALAALRGGTVEIALLDFMLPDISGLSILELVRDREGISVIMTSGYSTLENAVQFLKAGACDFLPKPFTCDELLSCVQRAAKLSTLPADERRRRQGPPPGCYQLGLHSWARVESDRTATIGVSRLFCYLAGGIRGIELPAVNSEIRQGGPLLQLVADDGLSHTVWSALSGRVIATHSGDGGLAGGCREEGDAGGALVRVAPDNLDSELMNLSAGG
jgi:CheY-like chemotaxis protein